MKNFIRQVHLYLGLISGIIVFILGITGCLYVFTEEISSFAYEDRREIIVPEKKTKLPLSDLKKIAEAEIPDGIRCTRAFLFPEKNHSVAFVFQKINNETIWYNSYMEFYKTVFVNPYTGEIHFIENTKWEFFNVLLWLHITLLFSYPVGNPIILWSCFIFIALLVSGIVLWWPKKSKNAIKRAFSFPWKTSTNWKRKNYDLHNVPGFYSFVPSLLFSLTGLLWASENVHIAIHWIANGGKTPTEQPAIVSDTTFAGSVIAMDQAVSQTIAASPDYKYIMLAFPRNKQHPITVRVNENKMNFLRQELYFDQYSGKLLEQINFTDKNSGDQLQALNYDIHVGSILGIPGKILAFLGSLVCASLPITGFLIWWNKHR